MPLENQLNYKIDFGQKNQLSNEFTPRPIAQANQ